MSQTSKEGLRHLQVGNLLAATANVDKIIIMDMPIIQAMIAYTVTEQNKPFQGKLQLSPSFCSIPLRIFLQGKMISFHLCILHGVWASCCH